ncbi:hypothetical protein TrRE_jg13496 [Triparma retinervis]|uniref:Uncharacterized protein n=1 Tax=Triparma retinervis TaxID=2557542 RepID=A0A9W7DUQ9_9STRA|nr:hypothetical protein TrRE_jg13496 [Triparma retinervis]
MGASGVPSDKSFFKSDNFPKISTSSGREAKKRVTAFFSGGLAGSSSSKKGAISSQASTQWSEERQNFWAPDFDIKMALAEAPSEGGEHSQNESDEVNAGDDFDSFSNQLRGYIDLLKEQHSNRKIKTQQSGRE